MSKILVKLFVVLISIHKCFAVIANPNGNRIQCTSNWKLYNPNLIFCISTVTKIGYTFQKNTCIKMSKI